jgi:hypothetical protein
MHTLQVQDFRSKTAGRGLRRCKLGMMPTSELSEVQKCRPEAPTVWQNVCMALFAALSVSFAASSLMSPRRAKFEIVPNCSLFLVVNRRYGEHLNFKTRRPWAIEGCLCRTRPAALALSPE